MNPDISQPLPVLSTDEIREILVRRIDQQKQAVGIVVGVVEPTGRRVVAYGKLAKDDLANADAGTLDGDTIFEIGSVTKVFTSLVLADMVKRKEVALDDPAGKYLPENVKMPERNGKSITLLDLSTHTSGLPPLPNLKPNDPSNPYAGYGVDDLYQFLSGYTLPRDPASDLKGSEFEYSNLGAGLLGHILARRAGTDYESLIRSRITEPLGMHDTGITLSSLQKQRMATGHSATLAPVAKPQFLPLTLAGAGALRSSVNDMLTFLEAFLGYKETPLAPAMKSMLEVRRSGPAGKMEIGLAWLIVGDGAFHDGGTEGFRSFVAYNPKAGSGVVVLSNTFTLAGVLDLGIHVVNSKIPLAHPEPPKHRTGIQMDPELLDNYTGRYELPDRVLEITRDGDRLFMQAFTQAIVGPKFEVLAESERSFFVKASGSQITFEIGPEGRATSLTLHRAGREPTTAPRLS